jgi:hypothetical protein
MKNKKFLKSIIDVLNTFDDKTVVSINIDYKYFAGAKDPIEVLNKYRMRGYSVYLNDKEKVYVIGAFGHYS